jgi:hypothetical protein
MFDEGEAGLEEIEGEGDCLCEGESELVVDVGEGGRVGRAEGVRDGGVVEEVEEGRERRALREATSAVKEGGFNAFDDEVAGAVGKEGGEPQDYLFWDSSFTHITDQFLHLHARKGHFHISLPPLLFDQVSNGEESIFNGVPWLSTEVFIREDISVFGEEAEDVSDCSLEDFGEVGTDCNEAEGFGEGVVGLVGLAEDYGEVDPPGGWMVAEGDAGAVEVGEAVAEEKSSPPSLLPLAPCPWPSPAVAIDPSSSTSSQPMTTTLASSSAATATAVCNSSSERCILTSPPPNFSPSRADSSALLQTSPPVLPVRLVLAVGSGAAGSCGT